MPNYEEIRAIVALLSVLSIVGSSAATAWEMKTRRRGRKWNILSRALYAREIAFVAVFLYAFVAEVLPEWVWWAVVVPLNVFLWFYVWVIKRTPPNVVGASRAPQGHSHETRSA